MFPPLGVFVEAPEAQQGGLRRAQLLGVKEQAFEEETARGGGSDGCDLKPPRAGRAGPLALLPRLVLDEAPASISLLFILRVS